MRTLKILPALVILMIASTAASVFAQYNPSPTVSVPILGTSGAPALSGNQFSGVMTVLYADGMPVVLESNKVSLFLCASSCTTIDVILKHTAPGTYAYSFSPPTSLTGTITITVLAGALADDNGRIFPSVETQIGTYAAPSLTSSSSVPSQVLPASPPTYQQSNSEMRQAVAVAQPAPVQQSSMVGIVLHSSLSC